MKDTVVRTAFLLQGLLPGMGHAGFAGFSGLPAVVHNIKGPYECCTRCHNGTTGLIHNVDHPEFGHSDQFITSTHAERFWLPFLWGMEPSEYEEFLDLCHEASELEERHDEWKLALVESELRDRPWRWASGSLAVYFRKRLSDILTLHTAEDVEDAVDRAVGLIWRLVHNASHVRKRTFSVFLQANPNDRRTLDPKKVVSPTERDELMALRPECAALKVLSGLVQDLQADHAAE